MQLLRLKISNFRNLKNVELKFTTRIEPLGTSPTVEPLRSIRSHALIGQNGTGKSNLMEALITIFRDVDLDRDAAFDYELEYSIRGHDIQIRTDLAKQRRPFVWIDGEQKTQEYLTRNDPPNKMPRDERRGPRLLPSHIFAYYSGRNERMEVLFQEHQYRFNRRQEITAEEVLPEQLLRNFSASESDIRNIAEVRKREDFQRHFGSLAMTGFGDCFIAVGDIANLSYSRASYRTTPSSKRSFRTSTSNRWSPRSLY